MKVVVSSVWDVFSAQCIRALAAVSANQLFAWGHQLQPAHLDCQWFKLVPQVQLLGKLDLSAPIPQQTVTLYLCYLMPWEDKGHVGQ